MTVHTIWIDGRADHQTGVHDIDAWVHVVQATHEALEGRPVQVAAKPSEKDTLNVDHGLFDNAKKVLADD